MVPDVIQHRSNYILVMMKLPEPVQPVPPVRDQVPEMVFPFTVPDKVSALPLGDPDVTLN
jgi:hypothetical protein